MSGTAPDLSAVLICGIEGNQMMEIINRVQSAARDGRSHEGDRIISVDRLFLAIGVALNVLLHQAIVSSIGNVVQRIMAGKLQE